MRILYIDIVCVCMCWFDLRCFNVWKQNVNIECCCRHILAQLSNVLVFVVKIHILVEIWEKIQRYKLAQSESKFRLNAKFKSLWTQIHMKLLPTYRSNQNACDAWLLFTFFDYELIFIFVMFFFILMVNTWNVESPLSETFVINIQIWRGFENESFKVQFSKYNEWKWKWKWKWEMKKHVNWNPFYM